MSLTLRLQDAMKAALRAKESQKLQAIRMILAGIKQKEIDEQITLDDAAVVALLTKMAKQRRDAIEQYRKADRPDLADKEQFELDLIESYLPEAADEAEIEQIITEAITEVQAKSIKDMAGVMAIVKTKLTGRADMGQVSQQIKSKLTH